MAKRKRIENCYLCGRFRKVTRDHIFPKGLFPLPIPQDVNLPTAPACSECHSASLSKDEEIFRIYAASGLAYENPVGNKLWKERIRPDLQGRRPRLRQTIKKMLETRDTYTTSGIFLGRETGMAIEADRLKTVFDKIAKGLYYKETCLVLGNDVEIRVEHTANEPEYLESEDLQNLLSDSPKYCLGDGVVNYWRMSAVDDPRATVTLLAFYGYNNSSVILTVPPENASSEHFAIDKGI